MLSSGSEHFTSGLLLRYNNTFSKHWPVRLVFLQFVFENLYLYTVFKGDFNGVKIEKPPWKDAML